MGPVSSKNSDRKRVFWVGQNFAPGHFCPQSRHLVRLAYKIGEVRFSTKIQTENVFFGKKKSRGLLRQNWAKFSSGTILPPNAPYRQLGLEKRYGAGFVKKFRPKTSFLGWKNFAPGHFCPQSPLLFRLAKKIGEVRFCTKFKPKTCVLEKWIWEGFWGKIEQSFRPEQFCSWTHHIGN